MDKYTSKHLCFLLFGTAIVSLKTYPTLFTRNGGRDTWLSMIVASILAFIFLIFILNIFKKSQFQSLFNIYHTALGKWIGGFFFFFFIATLFLTLLECASVEASSMHINILIDTPPWQFLLFFIPPALYTVKKGKAAIITITMIAIVLVTISGIDLSILTLPYKHIDYLRPILEDGITNGLITAMLQELGVYGSLAIIFPYMTDIKDTTSITKYLALGMLFIVQMEIIALSGVLMTFEIEALNTMSFPKLLQTQLIDEFNFLEAGELFVMLQIVGGWFIKYIITFYALHKLIEEKIKIKYLSIWISILAFIGSYFASKNLFTLFKLLNYYAFISLFNFIIIPFIIFIIYAIRGYPKTKPSV